jgi:putative membrane protein
MDSNERQPDSRTFVDYVGLTARGFAMGASDIVPGVSGGTMALIMGIYEELIGSIKAVLNRDAIRLALRLKFKQALELIPWQFLASVAIGIFLAVFTMSWFLEWVLEHYASLLWAFFFGLVAASILTVSRQVKKWGSAPVVGVVVGALGAYLLVGLVPAQTPNTWWFLFLCGVIAISAMVLPGVSGSFMLVLLGKYEYLLNAVTELDLLTLFMVIAGAGVGIVSVAQLLSWLFKKYHDGTVAVLMGMLIGSLRKVWPWKITLETILDRHGKEVPIKEANVLPEAWTWEVVVAVLLAVAAFALILSLTLWAARKEKAEAQEASDHLG